LNCILWRKLGGQEQVGEKEITRTMIFTLRKQMWWRCSTDEFNSDDAVASSDKGASWRWRSLYFFLSSDVYDEDKLKFELKGKISVGIYFNWFHTEFPSKDSDDFWFVIVVHTTITTTTTTSDGDRRGDSRVKNEWSIFFFSM